MHDAESTWKTLGKVEPKFANWTGMERLDWKWKEAFETGNYWNWHTSDFTLIKNIYTFWKPFAQKTLKQS